MTTLAQQRIAGDSGLRADVETLAARTRDSAGAGERAAAEWIAGRLEEEGASDVRVEPYRGRASFGFAYALLAAAGLLAGRLPRRFGWPLALATLAALEADASGRAAAPGPTAEGTNVVARIPAARPARTPPSGDAHDTAASGRAVPTPPSGDAHGTAAGGRAVRTLVVVAHHDAARTGPLWNPRLREPGAARRLRTRRIAPYLAPVAAALLGHRTRAGRGVLWGWLAASLHLAGGPTVPGANDNATGVAALLALARRWATDPLPGVEVLLVAPGSEESGMAGMRAFLAAHPLDPAATLVLSLDTLGSGEPIVLEREWAVLPARYRPADLALADAGARHAGLDEPPRWTIGGWTDAVLARHAGLPAISLLSIGPKGAFTNYHVRSDTPDRVDFDSVERCVRLAAGIGEAWAAEG